MASKQELRALITLAGRIDPSLQTALLKASGESMKVAQNMKKAGQEMSNNAKKARQETIGLGTIVKGSFLGDLAANAVSNLSSGVLDFGMQSIKLASDLNEVQNVVDTTFGTSSKQIDAWSQQTLNSYGLSMLQAKQYSGTMGAMLKSSGVTGNSMVKMSENLTALSGDLASFYNLNTDEAFEKIRSGISGETEPLKQLGINMNVANLEAFALSKGITTAYNDMDQASQTLLRYNYLMSVSKDAQGDFTKTQGQFANQQRLFDTNLKQASATITQKALPSLTALYQKANDYVSNINLDKVIDKSTAALSLMGNTIIVVSPLLVGLTAAYAAHKAVIIATTIVQQAQNIATGISNGLIAIQCTRIEYQTVVAAGGSRVIGVITAAQWLWNAAMTANPIGAVIVAVAGLAAGIYYLFTHFEQVTASIQKAWTWLAKLIGLSGGKVDVGMGNFKQLEAQGYAEGGIATRPSIFGEAGPEIAIPLQRTPRSLGLLSQAQRIMGAGTSGDINISYSPVIQGSSGPEVQQALGASFEQFKSWAEQYFQDKARVSYG